MALFQTAADTFTINQAAAVIKANGYTGVYDGKAHGATGSATGLNNVNLSSLLSLGDSFTDVPGGTADWYFAGNSNYQSASGTASITISPATPVVHTVNENATYNGTQQSYPQLGSDVSVTGVGTADPTPSGNFGYSYFSSALNYGPTKTAPTLPGTYTVTAAFTSSDTNYSNATGTAILTISLPTVTVGPTAGSQIGGTSVTITGTDFVGVSAVKFGSMAATSFTVNSATQITAIAPAEAAGTVDVTVLTSLGTSSTSSLDRFTYVPASTLSFTTPPPATLINKTSVSVIRVFVTDQFGNRVPGTSVTITYPSGSGTKTITAVSDSTGTASVYNLPIFVANVDSQYFMTAATTGVPTVSVQFSVTGTAYALTFNGSTYSATAGTNAPTIPVNAPTIPVQVIDSKGLPVSVDSPPVNVTLTIAGAKFSNGSATATAMSSAGLASFTGLSVDKAGTFTLTASSSGLFSTFTTFTITAAGPFALSFSSQPKSTTAGNTISTVNVVVLDPYRNFCSTVSDVSVTISYFPTPILFDPSNVLTTTTVNGLAAFSAMAVDTAGTYFLTASASGLNTSSPSNKFAISHANGSILTFSNGGGPANTSAGSPISPVTLTLTDGFHNVIPAASVSIALYSGTTLSLFTSGIAVGNTNALGQISFTNLTKTLVGTYTLKATSSGITQSSNSFSIIPAAAYGLSFFGQPTSTQAGVPLGGVSVEVIDRYGNVETLGSTQSYNISLTLSSGPAMGSGTANGSANPVSITTSGVTKTGTYALVAKATGLASATSKSFAITPSSPAKMTFITQPANGQFVNSTLGATTGTVIVQLLDAYGNYVNQPNVSVIITIDNPGGTAAVPGYSQKTITTNSLGQAVFSMMLTTKGTYALLATATTTNNFSATSKSFVVTQAAPRWV